MKVERTEELWGGGAQEPSGEVPWSPSEVAP